MKKKKRKGEGYSRLDKIHIEWHWGIMVIDKQMKIQHGWNVSINSERKKVLDELKKYAHPDNKRTLKPFYRVWNFPQSNGKWLKGFKQERFVLELSLWLHNAISESDWGNVETTGVCQSHRDKNMMPWIRVMVNEWKEVDIFEDTSDCMTDKMGGRKEKKESRTWNKKEEVHMVGEDSEFGSRHVQFEVHEEYPNDHGEEAEYEAQERSSKRIKTLRVIWPHDICLRYQRVWIPFFINVRSINGFNNSSLFLKQIKE